MVKHHARKQLCQLLDNVTTRQWQEKSVQACRGLCLSPEFQKAELIMMFLSIPKEVDTVHAMREAFRQKKTVLVPSVAWETQELIPLTMDSIDCQMTYDRYNMQWPTYGKPVAIEKIDMIIVPGLGFDDKGNRLGRGKGFYDRFLSSKDFKGITCGLAIEEQVMEYIPVDHHDISINMLITDKKTRRFDNR